MLVYLVKKDYIKSLNLPSHVRGSYWITDRSIENDEINLINIEAKDGNWVLKSNSDIQVFSGGAYQDELLLQNYSLCNLNAGTELIGQVWCAPSYDTTYKMYSLAGVSEINIGKGTSQDIHYNYNLVNDNQLRIVIQNGQFNIINIDRSISLYVNKKRVDMTSLVCGDVIFIAGLKIIFMGQFIAVNNPLNLIKVQSDLSEYHVNNHYADIKENLELNQYQDTDYFAQKPRFITEFQRKTVVIDSPPNKNDNEEKPAIYTIGPMVTMGIVSVAMLGSAINGIVNDGRTFTASLTTIVMAIAMLGTMVMWPILSRKYDDKMKKKHEIKRQKKYKEYLMEKANDIFMYMKEERQIIVENTFSIDGCADIILRKKMRLWEKELEHNDFLTVRLGIGSKEPNLEIKYPEEHFSMTEDNLKQLLAETVNRNKIITNVPITLSLTQNNKLAVIGEDKLAFSFIDSIILQISALQSFQDVKIILFTDNIHSSKYEYLKVLPHCYSNSKDTRFFCSNSDDIKQISNYLEQIYNVRKYKDDTNELRKSNYKNFSQYYVIVVDDLAVIRNSSLIHTILDDDVNYGFTVMFRSQNLSDLPNECSTFINISGDGGKTSGLFKNDLVAEKQTLFAAELNLNNRIDMYKCAEVLANIPMKNEKTGFKSLPDLITFLEMYKVGKVEQLNVLNKWANNNPIISLQAPVGIDESGDLFKLDLHEKFHGPHGLIAGMTGSGKSEFIITLVLSLAINYHPDEVQFVLIDYKGGGLAGAFENKDTGVRLPHVAGTITNLDIVEMNRSLDSIQSELRRRQTIFKEAKEKNNEGTMDIYKYQKMYRDGLVNTPIAHLFIISDEFAELKMQQPEFMNQLISTSRIGRSLGVHLILATQKPAGIVNDQIWSNSKFRICLKVQDKSDSMDMLKCPDAASLKQVGRFYLQVGYNEFFALGQSAWTGAPYYPSETVKKHLNTTIDFIDNIGYIIKSDKDINENITTQAQGEQLTNIVKYLSSLAQEENINIKKLWLDRIPAEIYTSNLKLKYNYKTMPFDINPIIGEFDDPNNQRQGLLTLPLSQDGNTVIYGAAGSGKENLLTTIIHSCITEYSPEEVNFYILDFGAETLSMFKDAPHVGDFITVDEEEKTTNLFRLLFSMMEQRKQILTNYNGNFNLYNKNNSKKLPLVVVIINNYEAFFETYVQNNEYLITLSRSCVKYGISIIMTVNGANGVRYRLSQNFKQTLSLQLNDRIDYSTVIGRTHVYPSEIFGRGIIKLDDIYEFQTAYAVRKEELSDVIKKECLNLKAKYNYKALAVPVLPDVVSSKLFANYSIQHIPIGIDKEDLSTVTFDFKNNYVTTIMSLSNDYFNKLTRGLSEIFSKLPNTETLILDAGNLITKNNYMMYCNNNFDSAVQSIYQRTLDTSVDKKHLFCIVLCYNVIKSKLSIDNVTLLEKILMQNTNGNVSFILIDTVDVFRNISLTNWYKNSVNSNVGIWIGSGIAEQFALKVINLPRGSRTPIKENFGYVVDRGNTHLVKLIEGDDNE